MPTYDYVCEECSHEFEAFQRITADPLKECPKCGGLVHRKIGAGAGLVFKGSGFYITDYKNKHSSQSNNSNNEKKSGATKSTTEKTGKKKAS